MFLSVRNTDSKYDCELPSGQQGIKSQKAIDFAHKHKFIENEMYATEVWVAHGNE